MFCPSKPCGHLSLVIGLGYVFQLVERAHLLAKIPLYALSDELLLAVELISYIIKCPAMTVVPVYCYRKYLPVVLNLQLQFILDVRLHETMEKLPELVLTRMIEHEVICIFVTVNSVNFIHTVHEICHCKVGKVLR